MNTIPLNIIVSNFLGTLEERFNFVFDTTNETCFTSENDGTEIDLLDYLFNHTYTMDDIYIEPIVDHTKNRMIGLNLKFRILPEECRETNDFFFPKLEDWICLEKDVFFERHETEVKVLIHGLRNANYLLNKGNLRCADKLALVTFINRSFPISIIDDIPIQYTPWQEDDEYYNGNDDDEMGNWAR